MKERWAKCHSKYLQHSCTRVCIISQK